MINKLITAMNECTEWGQIFLLDAIANYSTEDEKEMQSICERLTPRLAHANSAVVLSTVKVRRMSRRSGKDFPLGADQIHPSDESAE